MPNGVAVVIGVNDNPAPAPPGAAGGELVRYAEADAAAVAAFLQRRGYAVERLAGAEATREGILAALARQAALAGPLTPLVVYFAGRGAVDPYYAQQAYLLPAGADPADLSGTALAVLDVARFFPPRAAADLALFDCNLRPAGRALAPPGGEPAAEFTRRVLAGFPPAGRPVVLAHASGTAGERESLVSGLGRFTQATLAYWAAAGAALPDEAGALAHWARERERLQQVAAPPAPVPAAPPQAPAATVPPLPPWALPPEHRPAAAPPQAPIPSPSAAPDTQHPPPGTPVVAIGRPVGTAHAPRLIHSLRGHLGVVNSVAFPTGGHRLASGASDGSVRIWDLSDGKTMRALSHGAWVRAVAYAPDGYALASAAHDGDVRIWDPPDGSRPWKLSGAGQGLPGQPRALNAVAFSHRGMLAAASGDDGLVWVWHWPTAELLIYWEQGPTGAQTPTPVNCLAFAPTRQLLAAGDSLGRTELRLLPQGTWQGTYHEPEGGILTVAFSLDGTVLATGGGAGLVRLWYVETGTLLTTLALPAAVRGLAFSPDGRHLAVVCADGTLLLWDAPAGGPARPPWPQHAGALGCSFSADGAFLAVASGDWLVRVWAIED